MYKRQEEEEEEEKEEIYFSHTNKKTATKHTHTNQLTVANSKK